MHFWHFVNVKIPGFKKKEIVYNYMGKFILKSRFSVQVTTPNKHRIIIKLMKNVNHRGISRHHCNYYCDLLIDSYNKFQQTETGILRTVILKTTFKYYQILTSKNCQAALTPKPRENIPRRKTFFSPSLFFFSCKSLTGCKYFLRSSHQGDVKGYSLLSGAVFREKQLTNK